jgi:hypothetical protein
VIDAVLSGGQMNSSGNECKRDIGAKQCAIACGLCTNKNCAQKKQREQSRDLNDSIFHKNLPALAGVSRSSAMRRLRHYYRGEREVPQCKVDEMERKIG